jgi:GntR family transcriptional regulator
VRSPEEAVDHVLTDQPDWVLRAWATVTARASAEGRSTEDEFTARMEPASAEVARWLGIKSKAWVVARATRRLVDGKPWSWEVSYYPREVAELVGLDSPTAIVEGDTQRLDASGHPEVAWQAVASSHPARPDEADALDVPIGRWITDVVRIGATRERIVRVTRARFVADENQLVSEVGDEAGLRVIRSTLNSGNGELDAR